MGRILREARATVPEYLDEVRILAREDSKKRIASRSPTHLCARRGACGQNTRGRKPTS